MEYVILFLNGWEQSYYRWASRTLINSVVNASITRIYPSTWSKGPTCSRARVYNDSEYTYDVDINWLFLNHICIISVHSINITNRQLVLVQHRIWTTRYDETLTMQSNCTSAPIATKCTSHTFFIWLTRRTLDLSSKPKMSLR